MIIVTNATSTAANDNETHRVVITKGRPTPHTCEHCKWWFVFKSIGCNKCTNTKVTDIVTCDEWGEFLSEKDFGCIFWE
jgi:hypothetical protein